MGYWIENGRSAFWKSLLFFFDDPKKAPILFVLGAAVPLYLRSSFGCFAAKRHLRNTGNQISRSRLPEESALGC
jgi:hypothetical protein